MEQSRPPKQQPRSAPVAPSSAARTAPAPQGQTQSRPAAPQAKARPAPPPVQQRPAVAPPPVAVKPPQAAQPIAQTVSPEHLTITPQMSAGGAPSIEFDWEPAALGTNRSYACTVTTEDGTALSVTLAQGMYRRSFDGIGAVRVPVIPPAIAGTQGTLTARHGATGASSTFAWQWQPRSQAGSVLPAPPRPAGLLARLFGRTKPAAAVAAKPQIAPRVASVAERLGPRAAQAVSLKFFGQDAVGQRFAFILDRSGSMSGSRWHACTKQLQKALRSLPDTAEFFVVLFSSRNVEPPGQSGWARADRDRIESVLGWVRGVHPGGGTDPEPAFKRVFSMPYAPDVIYFLTDGELEGFTPATCAGLRGSAPTLVNTIALENGASAEALRGIAAESGGQFVLIPDAASGGPDT